MQKAVNFGVVYGISDFGLSNNLGISRKPRLILRPTSNACHLPKDYMERVVREARDKGYVETLFKRRRKIPDIQFSPTVFEGFAERTAINSPIQGSAADIFKIAMIHLDQALEAGYIRPRCSLQVHDEIVLQVPSDELAAIKELVKETMESAIELAVPLEPMKTKARHGMKPNKGEFVQNRKR